MFKKFIMPGLLAAALLWLMFGMDREKPAQVQTLAMGTLVDITVLGLGGQSNFSVANDALREVRALEKLWHPDTILADGSSLLASFNQQLQAGTALPVPEALQSGFAAAARYSQTSGGLFDPAIGGLVKAWGFHTDSEFRSTPPDAERLKAHQQQPGFDQIYQSPLLQGSKGLRLDFGAFAKGLLLQEVANNIQQQYPDAAFLLNGGGDLVAVGERPGRPWRIAVRHPRMQNRYLALISLNDGEAAFTSGDYERFFDAPDSQGQAKHYHHILDPRTGWPAQGTQSLTVLHHDAGLADAASTALFVAGDDWPQVAAAMGIDAVLRVAADGRIEWTPAMAERAELTSEKDGAVPDAILRLLP